MALVRAQCVFEWSDSLPRDAVTHTLHFSVAEGVVWGGAEFDSLASDLRAIWDGFTAYSTRKRTVKLYDLDDPMPRPVKAISASTNTPGAMSGTGNRDVALCLSYYGERNLPRTRGRIYLGPFSATDVGGQKPPAALTTLIQTLPPAFSGLGGPNVDWVVYSPTGQSHEKVQNWWIDNEWDTQRRRGLKGDTRIKGTTGG